MQGISAAQRKQLSRLAFIPVANSTRLVAPACLFARLRSDLSPIAFELPPSLTSRTQVLQELGMKEAPLPNDLMDFLQVGSYCTATSLQMLMALWELVHRI